MSSIFSTLASALFICLSCRSTPWSTNCCSAFWFACTACNRAASMPANALPSMASISTGPAGFNAAPAELAWVTVLSTLRMFSSVSSRPCKAFSVASLTALRKASPCLAVASENMVMSASWSIPALIMLVSWLWVVGLAAE